MSADGDLDIAAVGALVADPTRCRILRALGDGRALPAGRLADAASVTPATASSHLGKLVDAGMLRVEAVGRARCYRLAGPEVGELIEALERFARPAPVRSLRQSTRAEALRAARTCYDHLAGCLGVDLMQAMIDRGHLAAEGPPDDPDVVVTDAGADVLGELGVPVRARAGVRHHLDTTARRPHLTGALGRGLWHRMLDLGWLRRGDHSHTVVVLPAGRRGLAEHFGMTVAGS